MNAPSLTTAYRLPEPPASCARCGAPRRASRAHLCAGCQRRARRRTLGAFGILALVVAGGITAWRGAEHGPPAAPPLPPREPPPLHVAPSYAAARDAVPEATTRIALYRRTLAIVPGTATEPAAVLVLGDRPCAPRVTCRELALVDHGVRWHAPVGDDDAFAVADGVVLIGSREGVVARDAGTGAERWRRGFPAGGNGVPVLAPGAHEFLMRMPGGRVLSLAVGDGSVRFEGRIEDARPDAAEPVTPPRGVLALGDVALALEDTPGGATLVSRRAGHATLRPVEVEGTAMLAHDSWLAGRHLVALVARSDFDPAGRGAAPTFALRVGHHARDGLRLALDLGHGHWQRPTSDAPPAALVAFRAGADGDVFALADRGDEAVLVALRGEQLAPRWIRTIALAGGARPPTPVDFVASRELLAVALDGGRVLARLETHSGALLGMAGDVQIR
jgi:hypothetical protein